MEFSVDEKNLKVEDRVGSDPAKEQRLKDIRQTFHPMFIPTLTVAEQRGPTEVTFHLKNEDHTLCNPLREVLNRHPAVLHVGYTIPHPSERTVAFILHVKEGHTCQDVMRDGFRVLMEIFDTLGKKFTAAVIEYKNNNGIPLDEEDLPGDVRYE